MATRDENVLLEDARIIFRNFAGNENQYNPAGRRNFSVVLTPEVAEELTAKGWNVKNKPPREEGDDPLFHLPVTVSFKGIPPRLYMITKSKNKRTILGEETAELLDYAELEMVDVIISPYDWEVNGNTGRKAYVKTLYATIREDELDLKYSDVEDEGQSPRMLDHDEGEPE